jgi:hypothetical protein
MNLPESIMNEFSSRAHAHASSATEDELPTWSDVLLRQEDLPTPYWVDQWLATSAMSTPQNLQEELSDTWPGVFMARPSVEAPAWQEEWLAWADSRPNPKPPLRPEPAWIQTGRRLATLDGLRGWLGRLILAQPQACAAT